MVRRMIAGHFGWVGRRRPTFSVISGPKPNAAVGAPWVFGDKFGNAHVRSVRKPFGETEVQRADRLAMCDRSRLERAGLQDDLGGTRRPSQLGFESLLRHRNRELLRPF